MPCKIFHYVHCKCPVMVVLFSLVFFLSYCCAGPVPGKNFYEQFIDYLNKNKCHMPNEIELPFPESGVSWEYLSTPLRECQTPEAIKPDEEVFMLCSEIFENLKNISCSNASAHLSRMHVKLSTKLSDEVCGGFNNAEAFIPRKKNYLGQRLMDTVICKVICANKFESLCATLLWSYETLKQIADTLKEESSTLNNEENGDINGDLILPKVLPQAENKYPGTDQAVNGEPMNPSLKKSDKAVLSNDENLPNKDAFPDNEAVHNNEANNIVKPESEHHLLQEIAAKIEKPVVEPFRSKQIEKLNVMPKISTSIVTKGTAVSHSHSLNSGVSDMEGNQETDDHQSETGKQIVTLKEKADQVNEIYKQLGKDDLGKDDLNEGHPVVSNNVSREMSKQALLPETKSKDVADTELNEVKGTDVQQIKSKDGEKIGSVKVIPEAEKQSSSTNAKALTTQHFGSSPNLNSKSSNDLTLSLPKEAVSVSVRQNVTSKGDTSISHVAGSDLAKDKVSQNSENSQSHKAAEPDSKNLKGVSVEPNSKLIHETTTVEAALENMETGNEVNRHPEKDLEQYNDLENNEGEEGEYSRSDYDGGLYQPSKSKDPDTKLTASIVGSNDEIRNRDDVFSMKNTAGRVPDDIQMIPSFPEQEDSHFFFYFLSIVLILMAGYLIFHNKQKIIALIVEGRHERRRRSHGVGYKKLETK